MGTRHKGQQRAGADLGRSPTVVVLEVIVVFLMVKFDYSPNLVVE